MVVFRDKIASLTRATRWNFNEELKVVRARFKNFPGALNHLLLCIDSILKEGKFDRTLIHIEMLNSTSVLDDKNAKHPQNSKSQVILLKNFRKLASTKPASPKFAKSISFIILIKDGFH